MQKKYLYILKFFQQNNRLESKFMKLYHLTNLGNIESILKNGLDPNCSKEHDDRDRYIYLSKDISHAEGYENHHGDWIGSVLISVESENLEQKYLGPDDVDLPDLLEQDDDDYREFDEVPWEESLQISGQCTYNKIIPASILEITSKNTSNS